MKTKASIIAIEDILFWTMVIATIGVVLWKLNGSPTDMATIIGIGTFILVSEIAVWKKIFSLKDNFNSRLSVLDKNTSISFLKVKHDMEKINIGINNRFNNLENNLGNIENKLNIIEKKLR